MKEEEAAQPTPKAFKAQPVNKAMLKGPLFKVKHEDGPLTQPESPKLRTKTRSASHPKPRPVAAPKPKPFKARPIMGEAPPALPQHNAGRARPLTQPKPFHLRSMDRHAQYEQHKKAALARQAEEERKAREFKARPIPVAVESDDAAFRPAPATNKLTEPKPFHLRSVAKHEEWESQFMRKMAEETAAEAEAKRFHARPAPATTHSGAFVPEKSTKALTDHDNLQLATDRRAEQRAQFEYEVKQRKAAAEEARRAAAEEARAKEQEEERRIRKAMIFKARPVPNTMRRAPKPIASKKPLTMPKSPALGLARRGHHESPLANQENLAVM